MVSTAMRVVEHLHWGSGTSSLHLTRRYPSLFLSCWMPSSSSFPASNQSRSQTLHRGMRSERSSVRSDESGVWALLLFLDVGIFNDVSTVPKSGKS